jgi:hypothetical protein
MPTLDHIPYYASLAKVLHGPTLALVLTYLEIHHPAPQDTPEPHSSLANDAITLDCDTVCGALGISRRTLHIAFSCLGCWWGSEAERSRAARAGREFLNPAHSLKPQGHDPVKIYSFTGFKAYTLPHRILIMRRNLSKLTDVLSRAGFQPQTPYNEIVDTCAPLRSLCSLLARVMPAWGDRRAERWDRWRRENGKETRNPGRMRGAKKCVGSLVADVGYYDI